MVAGAVSQPTGYYNDLQLSIIDQRVRAALTVGKAVGVVVSIVDPLHVMVDQDNGSVAVPVKVAGHVSPRVGDRIVMNYYGPPGRGEWVVLGALSVRSLASGNVRSVLSSGTYGTAAWADLPGTPGFNWSKHNDTSIMRVQMSVTARVTGSSSQAQGQFGMKLTTPTGGVTTYLVTQHPFNLNDVWFNCSGFDRVASVPAGQYSVVGQWQMSSGTGTLGVDGNCPVCMEVTEEWIEVLP
jgi:hypothetical protein